MRTCIYCRRQKENNEFTLEHVIPQCLGGAYAPDVFKTRDVCRQCNSNLGLFVDASFEKNWFVSQFFREASYGFYDPNNPIGLPLTPMGESDLRPPELQENEVCESWIGPLGEQVFWVRPKDERLYWYVGGNPRTTKKVETRAYFLFSERSNKNQLLSWLSFRDSFEGRRVKKIMCTQVEGANLAEIGFPEPDSLDLLRIPFFLDECSKDQRRKNRLSLYIHYDFRFMAKLGLGLGYAIFGKKMLRSKYTEELRKALWHREGETPPNIRGSSAFINKNDQFFKDLTGDKFAVTVLILPSSEGVAVNLNLGCKMNWTVKCASYEDIYKADMEDIKDGLVIVLYRYLKQGFFMPLPRYIAYKNGIVKHHELKRISARAGLHADYFKNL